MKEIIATIAATRGVSPESLKKWRQRGYVPHKHRLPLITAAEKLGEQLGEKDFEFGSAKPLPKRKAKKAA